MNRIGMKYEMLREITPSDTNAKKATVEPMGMIAKRIQITATRSSAFSGISSFG